jgi:FtsH-binding integral membrane protein
MTRFAILLPQSCMFYSHDLVLVAAGLTALLVVGLTIFAFQVSQLIKLFDFNLLYVQTKIDFTACGGILFCVLFIFVICGILMGVIASTGAVNIPLLHVVYSGIGLIIFSVYLVYDTQVVMLAKHAKLTADFQMMMGGSHKYSISPEEYIFAAIAIYLDIINIFLYILRILGAANKS